MKRLLTLILAIITVFPGMQVSANQDDFQFLLDYKIVDYAYAEDTPLNRRNCLKMIMKSIGCSSSLCDQWDCTIFEFKPYTFDDISYAMQFSNIEEAGLALSNSYTTHHIDNQYFDIAWYADIVKGEQEGKYYRAEPLRNATVAEVTAMMLRCLNGTAEDLEQSFQKAKKIGLINKTDRFYNSPSALVYPQTMYTLIRRFLNQPVYCYVTTKTAQENFDAWVFQENLGKTYVEYLTELRNNNLNVGNRRPFSMSNDVENDEKFTSWSKMTSFQLYTIRFVEVAKTAIWDIWNEGDIAYHITVSPEMYSLVGDGYDWKDVYDCYCKDYQAELSEDGLYWTITAPPLSDGRIPKVVIRTDREIMSVTAS